MKPMRSAVLRRAAATIIPGAAAFAALLGTTPAHAVAFTVNTLGDPVSGTCAGGNGSLRQCVAAAVAAGGTQTVTFSVTGNIVLSQGKINVTAGNISISGPGARKLSVDGNALSRVLEVSNTATLHLSGLTVKNGLLSGSPYPDNVGAGLRVNSGTTATVDRVTFLNNHAPFGGALENRGTMTITNTLLTGNASDAAYSGAFENAGPLTMTNATFSDNHAPNGGGGAMGQFSTATISSSTFANNTAKASGALYLAAGTTTLMNTLLSGNTPQNCSGPVSVDNGHNLDSGTSCGFTAGSPKFDKPSTNPMLGALANNGGPTDTHALLAGSPAIDAAGSCPPPAADQRGVARPQGANCDIGAFELAVPKVTSVTPASGKAGDKVTITGSGFSLATQVHFGAAAATAFVVVNDTTITATVPTGSGTVHVSVSTPDGATQTTPADQFTYAAAVVASPSSTPVVPALPKAGSPASGSEVSLLGVAVLLVLGLPATALVRRRH